MTKKDQDLASSPEGDLSQSAFQTYVYLVKSGKPLGPREVMRGANLSSPSVAYRSLQKLIDSGAVIRDEYGDYVVKEKVGLNGYVWIGKRLLPRFMIFFFIFLGTIVAEVAILIPHLMARASIEGSFWLLTTVTIVSAGIFLFESLRFKKKRTALS
jgi:hypothetical protein